MNKIYRAAALLGLIAMLGVRAAEVEGLYAATVPAASQSEEQRAQALGQALAEVLVKVSGSREVLQAAAVKSALAKPQPWVQQFGYREAADGGAGTALWVRFDPEAVDALLRDNDLALWGRNRPQVLAWIALDTGGSRRLLTAEEDPELYQALAEPARRRGLPVELPLNDLEDRRRVTSSDVWGDFVEPIRAASERYDAGLILVGRLQRRGSGKWLGRWTLHGAEQDRWQGSGDSAAALLSDASKHYADLMARRFSPAAGGSSNTLALSIGGVYYFDDYLRLMRHLESLGQLDGLQPVRFEADRVWLTGTLRGDSEALRRSLALGRMLVPEAAPLPSAEAEDTPEGVTELLYYALRR
jgi:hypothetical protein